MKSSLFRLLSTLVLAVALAAAGCSDDGGTDQNNGEPADVGVDAADVQPDVGADVAADAADTADTADASIGFLCQPCTLDGQCGGAEDRCLTMPAGDQGCTQACDPEAEAPCPGGFVCSQVDEAGDFQCVPEEFTCQDNCSDVSCSGGQVCDPWTGDCIEPLGVCDTNCTTASVCGDGPEDFCVNMPGTGGERSCLTGCNPQAEVTECPVNYFCTPLTQDPATTEGICYPVEGTCVDRCAGVDCPSGENCNERTGQCQPTQFGYCENGCTNDAQCGGQDDVCLNLGIGDGGHCWQDCSAEGATCPDNYECASLQGTTLSICIPTGRTCEPCYDSSCYPDGVCDPTSGECVELQQDCTVAGCPAGQLCDPVSTQCVEPGRACTGDSWATDCDNFVTGCTTQRSGTEGTCEEICTADTDCASGESCVETNIRKFCLGDDLNGPLTCGTLKRTGTQTGKPCTRQSQCNGVCVTDGNLDGFCSTRCSSDAECGAGETCGMGPSGYEVCLPAQCECALTPAFSDRTGISWTLGLIELDMSQCDMWLRPSLADALTQLDATPLADELIDGLVELPFAAARTLELAAGELDATASTGGAIETAAAQLGLSVTANTNSYTYPGSESKLTQAVSAFITQAGGTPDTAALETAAADVPADFQDIAAPIISAAADALTARQAALQGAGWDAARQSEAFDGAPYLLLPGTAAQLGSAPDLSDAATAAAYANFPLGDLAQAAADLSATVEQAATGQTPGAWTGFSYVVDTPAGKIVLGDAADTTYDPAANADLSGPIAVLVDAGGNDTYKVPVGANQSVANGVAVAVDLDGADQYVYTEVADPQDTADTLTSDADGRQTPSGGLTQSNGPVSLSTTARQGAGRLGIGVLMDLGGADDTYRSLRMSQGAALFGVGLLFDDGGVDDYDAEAFAQGAAMKGLGVLWDAAGQDNYRVWHAGQGFGTAAGAGVLGDVAGNDAYEAVPGAFGGAGVLYLSPTDRGASNRNLAQGAGVGISSDAQTTGLGGGLGVLRDRAGADAYTAGTYAQGYGEVRGLGLLADAAGADVYDARGFAQGAGQLFAGGALFDQGAGDDQYNPNISRLRVNGQGTGNSLGWGFMYDDGGADAVNYMNIGGGVGLDGGLGFAFFSDGADTHTALSDASWGYAQNSVPQGAPLESALTVGVFVEAGDETDSYDRPNIDSSVIGDEKKWLQPDPATATEKGVGIDR